MKKCVLLMTMLAVSWVSFSADTYVWLHGLEGDPGLNTWDIYKAMYTPNNGYVLEYKSNNSINGIASDLYRNQIRPIDKGGTIVVIGHSMGGLVARSLLDHTNSISGLVTVGAAHNGSGLLKSVFDGRVYNFFANAVTMANTAIDASLWSGVFSAPPVTTLAAPLVLPVTVFKNRTVNSTLFLLKHAMNSGVGIYQFGHACVRDMIPGSTYLKQLNESEHVVPIVNVYGVEDHWQVVRALGSLSKVDLVKDARNIDVSYDKEFFPALQTGMAYVYQIQNIHNVVYNTLGIAAIFMPWIWITRELVMKARYEWDAIYRYLETGIHTDLAGVMGATSYKLQNYCIPKGVDLKKLTCKSAYLPVVTENDGILSRQDVYIQSGVTKHPVFNVRVQGVNHQEMGNHMSVRRLMNEILNQKIYGQAFAK